MCQEHLIAKSIINQRITNNVEFSYNDIVKSILDNGGILRTSSGTTVGNYLSQLEDFGVIKFNPKSSNFRVLI
jgi:hypothetical protein